MEHAVARRSGRPVNTEGMRLHVRMDPALKRRMVIRAAQDGLAVHELIERAVREYLRRPRSA